MNLITGFHRSGTSCVAGALYRAGLRMGDEGDMIRNLADNIKGHFELKEYVALNDRILWSAGYTWSGVFGFIASLGITKVELKNYSSLVTEAERLDKKYIAESITVKDPRFCLTLNFWVRVYGPEKTRVLVVLRDPKKAISSLVKRNSWLGYSNACFLYQVYMQTLWIRLNAFNVNFKVIEYEEVLNAETRVYVLKEALEFLSAEGIYPNEFDLDAACDFVDKSLNHEGTDKESWRVEGSKIASPFFEYSTISGIYDMFRLHKYNGGR